MADIKVVPTNDGPYHLQGTFTIVTEGGRVLEKVDGETWLCRCGHSANKPFCDGTHHKIGFKSDLDAEAAAAGTDGYEDVCAESDIEDGELKGVTVGHTRVVIGRVDGKLYAIGGVCTHQQAMLEDGELDGKIVTCPLHDSGFDITTGAVTRDPATVAEPIFDVKVEAGRVFVSRKAR